MKQTLKLLITCLIIIIWGFGIHGIVQAHINHSIPTAEHYSAEEIVELKTPTYTVPELPEVRLASFEDEFAVDPIIKNLTETVHIFLFPVHLHKGNAEIITNIKNFK
jgi:hypothetical protein